jgi:hypothetical protein
MLFFTPKRNYLQIVVIFINVEILMLQEIISVILIMKMWPTYTE